MKTIKLKIHSMVDIITNSSTVIYTYQHGSVNPAKELINEFLKLLGETDKTADDLFYFGTFCENDIYLESENIEDSDAPQITVKYGDPEYKKQLNEQRSWFENLKLSILKGEVEKPGWMLVCEEDDYSFSPDYYLEILPKDEKYQDLAAKLINFLNSPNHDGGRDG